MKINKIICHLFGLAIGVISGYFFIYGIIRGKNFDFLRLLYAGWTAKIVFGIFLLLGCAIGVFLRIFLKF